MLPNFVIKIVHKLIRNNLFLRLLWLFFGYLLPHLSLIKIVFGLTKDYVFIETQGEDGVWKGIVLKMSHIKLISFS